MMQVSSLSIVIPILDEHQALPELHAQLTAVLARLGRPYEIIFVDDGSRDGSVEAARQLVECDAHTQLVELRRHFGKAAALQAGFELADGDIIITLDGDLQDDPAEIPNFLAALAQGKDVVSGWKKTRYDPWHKVLPSRVFNAMVSWLTGVRLHDHNCGMKCYRAEVLREIRLYGELHRFIPVLADARGFKVGEVVIKHRPRRFGSSKYGVRRFVKGFLDLLTVKFLTGFGQRPQHLLGSIGLVSFLIGNVLLIYLTITWVIRQFWDDTLFLPLHERPLLIYALAALLLGAQMMSMGFLAELITAYTGHERESYSVAERTDDQV